MAVRSWQQKSRNKFRTNQTRFGMVGEKLSTISCVRLFVVFTISYLTIGLEAIVQVEH